MGSGKSAESIAENLCTDVKNFRNEAEYPRGDVWYVYDPWPEERVYDWEALDRWIESHLARGTKVHLFGNPMG